MNKYDVEHVQKMLNPIIDKMRRSSDKIESLSDEIESLSDEIESLSDEIELLSIKFKKIDHDFNNVKTVVWANRDLTKMDLDELTNKINLITKKE